MISVLISLLVFLLVAGIIFYIIGLLPIPQPWLNIARAICALIILLILLNYLGVFNPGHSVLR